MQILATGLDEDYRKPKNLADQVVRTLDDDNIALPDRLRLLALYIIYRDGLFPADVQKLVAHAQLPPQDAEVIHNLELLGVRTSRNIKDSRPLPTPLFPARPPSTAAQEEYALSRFDTAIQSMLSAHATGTLDPVTFPYKKPPLDLGEAGPSQSAASLRTAKPTWAKTKTSSSEPRQRIIVYMAGGATYSEARSCYESSRRCNREIYLVTSHMLTPQLFVRQVGDLSQDKRRLGIPADQPKKTAPAHLFEREEAPKVKVAPPAQPGAQQSRPAGIVAPPTQAMGAMKLNGSAAGQAPVQQQEKSSSGKLTKDPDKDKKKHRFFGSKNK